MRLFFFQRKQVMQVQNILGNICEAGNQLANDTKEKLNRFLSSTQLNLRQSTGNDGIYPRLDPIDEINSTGKG